MEFAELRAQLMRKPALAPAKNPLLGRWSLGGASQGGSDDFFSQMFGTLGSLVDCGPLVGVSQIEFLPDAMVSIAADGERAPAAVDYRRGKAGVFALTPRYVMYFEFLAPNHVQLAGMDQCKLARMSGAATAPVAAAAPSTPQAAVAPATGSSVKEGAAFRCSGAKVLVVKFCEDGPYGICQTWTAQDRHPPDDAWTPSAPKSEIEQQVNGCEVGTVTLGADSIVTFAPSS
jgi:hypothetical protein